MKLIDYKIDDWDNYVRLTMSPKYASWAFRGQADSSWTIQSTLTRYLNDFKVHRDAWEHQEERIIRIFKRKAHHYLKNVPAENDIMQWLSIMQHHGAPTRIIDFTWSPVIAAFFALQRATKECAVWAIYPAGFGYRKKIKFSNGTEIRPEKLWPENYKIFKDNFLSSKIEFAVQGEPDAMNDRLIAQSGTFAIPSVLHKPLEKILLNYPKSETVITKFVLNTQRIRETAMGYFHVTNINESTLFPGIDGMARSLAYELEYHWAYNPKSMKMVDGYHRPPYGLPKNVVE